MSMTCTVIKLSPKHDDKIKGILKNKRNDIYAERTIGGKECSLKFYIDNISSTNMGTTIDTSIDDVVVLTNKNGIFPAITTHSVKMHLFEDKLLENYLLIFSPRKIVLGIIDALNSLSKTDDWALPVIVKIDEKEELMRRKFGNFKKVFFKNMTDTFVRSAGIGGSKLEDSPDYARYRNNYGGTISAIEIIYGQYSIMITGFGTLFSHYNIPSEIDIIKDILLKMNEIKILS